MAIDPKPDTPIDFDEQDLPQDEMNNDLAEEGDPLEGHEEIQQALISLYATCKGEDRFPRLVEVKDVKRAEEYWAGRQYIWWSDNDQKYNLPTQPAASYGEWNIDDMPRFQFVTNIYQSRGLMVIGAVSGSPPRVKFFPDDAESEDDIDTAAARSKETRLIERWNPPFKMQQDEVYHAWTGGFIAWLTEASEDVTLGMQGMVTPAASESIMDETISCPNCGWSAPADMAEPPVPCPDCGTTLTDQDVSEGDAIPTIEDADEELKPKKKVTIEVFGALNVCRPQHTQNQSQWHYCGIEREIHYSILRARFKDKADEISRGLNQGQADVFERNARLTVAENTRLLTQTGAQQANLNTFVSAWFRPSAFWMLEKDQADNDGNSKRDWLLENFPNGIRIDFTGKVYCQGKKISMDDEIVSTHAMPGRGQHRNAVGTSMLSIQDRVNTLANIAMETYEYGIPITYRADDTFDEEADEDQRAAPGLEVPVHLRATENIQQRIMQVRADSISPDMQQHMTDLVGPVSDQISGTYPAVSGAGGAEGAPETLGQQIMQKNSAMGRQGVFYVNLRQAKADVMTLACRILEQNASGTVKVSKMSKSGEFENDSIDITTINGEAHAYPEGDENIPVTWEERSSRLLTMATSPFGQILMQDQENAELFLEAIGDPRLKTPGISSWRKQLREIGELIKIPEGEQVLTGIAPTVEVDKDTDVHAVEVAACMAWLNAEDGQRVKRENPMGWEAVKEHMLQHKQFVVPQPQIRPLSESLAGNLKDLPPAAVIQILQKQWGIQLTEQDFLNAAVIKQHEKHPAATPAAGLAPPAAPMALPPGPANAPIAGQGAV